MSKQKRKKSGRVSKVRTATDTKTGPKDVNLEPLSFTEEQNECFYIFSTYFTDNIQLPEAQNVRCVFALWFISVFLTLFWFKVCVHHLTYKTSSVLPV